MAQARTNNKQAAYSGGSRGTSGASHYLTDHDEIRRWAEERNAAPACVRHTGGKSDIGMIRLDFPGYSGETSLEHIDWVEWFQKFDENNLALLVQEETARGEKSNFNKIVGRETAEAREHGVKTSRHHPASGRASSSSHKSERTTAATTKRTPAATVSTRTGSRSAQGRSSASVTGTARNSSQHTSRTTKVQSIDSRAKSGAKSDPSRRGKKPAA
jgi:hypothetical protein